MADIISRHMKIKDIEAILHKHGMLHPPLGWHLSLWLLFNTYEADEAEVVGYGEQMGFNFIPREKQTHTTENREEVRSCSEQL